jgi:hypothetical protein
MMAKLGGFDDLPSNAQSFLTDYRARLETISEAESTALAVREVYSAYYSEMGGVGAVPEPKARTPTTEGKVVRFQRRPKPQPGLPPRRTPRRPPDKLSAARHSTMPMIRKSLTALLIFTLVRWHRAGFRRYWRWKSRRRGGRPPVETGLRALIRRMSIENPLWGVVSRRRASVMLCER